MIILTRQAVIQIKSLNLLPEILRDLTAVRKIFTWFVIHLMAFDGDWMVRYELQHFLYFLRIFYV